MEVSFIPVLFPQDLRRLVTFLASEEWPYHVNTRLTEGKVVELIEGGTFTGSNHRCFWIIDSSQKDIGFIRLFDLDDIDDGYPLFDLRIKALFRGNGIGGIATKWLTCYFFETWPKLDRVAGTTRVDNKAMRRAFKSSGYAKEGHIRKDWECVTGELYDTVKYGILREDWEQATVTPVKWNDEP